MNAKNEICLHTVAGPTKHSFVKASRVTITSQLRSAFRPTDPMTPLMQCIRSIKSSLTGRALYKVDTFRGKLRVIRIDTGLPVQEGRSKGFWTVEEAFYWLADRHPDELANVSGLEMTA